MSVSNHFLAAAVACFSFLYSAFPSAIAEDAPASASAKIERVRVGFNGNYKLGKWTHIVVDVKIDSSNDAPLRLELETLDPYGSLTTIQGPVSNTTAVGTAALEAYFRSGRLDSHLEVRVLAGESVLDRRRLRPSTSIDAELRQPIAPTEKLIVTIGKPAGIAPSADEANDSAEDSRYLQNAVLAELDDLSALPIDAQAFESVDTVVIANAYNLDGPRSVALQDWVRSGGKLIVAVGSKVGEFQQSSIASWIPVKVVEQLSIPDSRLSGIERFSREGEKIVATGRVKAAKLQISEGRVLVRSRPEEPLLVRVPYAFGQVTFLALDLNQPPLSAWDPIPSFCREMISERQASDEGKNTDLSSGQLSQTGTTELATQLHGMMDHFPSVSRFSSWMVMGLLLAYLIVIGPIDYLLVHKLLKKPRLTWITFPLMVIVGAGAGIVGASSSNGSKLLVNQIDVIDIDQQSQIVRSTSWVSPYSPENRRYDLAIKPLNSEWKGRGPAAQKNAPSTRTSWSGVAESTFGGMYRPGGFEPGRAGYTFLDAASGLKGFPIEIWSSRVVESRWTMENTPLVESSLKSLGINQLEGSMTHHLPVPIEQWIVAYGNRVFRPRVGSDGLESFQIHPNRVWNPNGPGVHQRELRGYLTRTVKRKVVSDVGAGEDILTARAKYDPLGLDRVDFMRMLTFHDAAGGKNYTGLLNQSLQHLDLSAFLRLDRAVLFGQIKVPSAELQLDGESVEPTNHVAFVRFLLPVERTEVIRATLPKLTKD